MSQEQFAVYFEQVFRHHNKVMNDFINATADSDDDRESPLALAEEDMDEACEPLNEVASEEAVSQNASLFTLGKLPESVPDCEAATKQLEALLQEAFKARQKIDLNQLPKSYP